jgi:hypothetical protein
MRTIAWISAFALTSSLGLAAETAVHSAKVNLPDNVRWAGKTLAGGRYTVSWQGEPDKLQITISKGHEVVAEGRGRLEESKIRFRDDAVVLKRDGSGPSLLTEIDLHGKTAALVLEAS